MRWMASGSALSLDTEHSGTSLSRQCVPSREAVSPQAHKRHNIIRTLEPIPFRFFLCFCASLAFQDPHSRGPA